MSKRSREQARLNQELENKIKELEAANVIRDEKDAQAEIDQKKGEEYFLGSGIYRNLDATDELSSNTITSSSDISSTSPVNQGIGGWTIGDTKKFGQISGSTQLAPGEISPSLPIGSGNIEQLYDSSNIT